MAVLHRVIHENPKPIELVNAEIPVWLCEIVEVLLEKNPDGRFQSAEDVADLLEGHLAHLQRPEAVPRPPRLPVREKLHDDHKPDTALGLFRQNVGDYAIQFAFVGVLFGVSFFIRSNFEGLNGGSFVILGAVLLVAVLCLSEEWPKWRERWRRHRINKGQLPDSHPRSRRRLLWFVGFVIVSCGFLRLHLSGFPGRVAERPNPAVQRPSDIYTGRTAGSDSVGGSEDMSGGTDYEGSDSTAKILSPIRSVELEGAKSGLLPTGSDFKYLTHMTFSPDLRSLAWVSRNKSGRHRLWVFDVTSGKERFQIESTEEVAAFSPDSKTIAFCGDETDDNPDRTDGREGVWLADAQTGQRQTFLAAELQPSNARSLVFDSKGERLALGHAHNWATPEWKGLVSIWNVKDKKEIQVLKDHDFRVVDARFSPDGENIIVLGEMGELVAWKGETIIARNHVELGGHAHQASAMFPTGNKYAVAAYSHEGRVPRFGVPKSPQFWFWEWQSNRLDHFSTHHDLQVACMAFSPDGRFLASGDTGGRGIMPATIRLHDASQGKELAVLKGHEGSILAVAFDGNGRLISASQDGTIKWWEIEPPRADSESPAGEELIESAILLKEFQKCYEEQTPADRTKMGSISNPFLVATGIFTMRASSPNFLRVTRQQEADFARGQFDEAGTTRRIDAMQGQLKDFNVTLPALSKSIVSDFEAGKLHGARLVLAEHLIQAAIDQVNRQLSNE
jgi:WD40 repeat protein